MNDIPLNQPVINNEKRPSKLPKILFIISLAVSIIPILNYPFILGGFLIFVFFRIKPIYWWESGIYPNASVIEIILRQDLQAFIAAFLLIFVIPLIIIKIVKSFKSYLMIN